MEGGCKTFPEIAELKKSDGNRYKEICHAIREDGAYVEAGENDSLIVRKLENDTEAFGVFGFSFLDRNARIIQGNPVDGVAPTFEAVADGSYPISRSLFVYFKADRIGEKKGLGEFLGEYVSERAMGEEGYLSDRSLIPLPADARRQQLSVVESLLE